MTNHREATLARRVGNWLCAVALLCGLAAQAEPEKIVYGTDDRKDYFEETDATRLGWADSTCALVSISQLSQLAGNRVRLETFPYTIGGFDPCDDEPFGTQPVAAFCTGFVVGQDLIATAGHCVTDEADLATTAFVFGFHMEDDTTAVTEFDANQVYLGVEIVGQALAGSLDHAVIRVDRPITAPGAQRLPVRREGDVAEGTPVGAIGHPAGLPTKLAFGSDTEVKDSSNSQFFRVNTDTYGGNSGSPVFNTRDNLVEGILVRGYGDFVLDPAGCFRSDTLEDDNGVFYEEVSKIGAFSELIPESGLSERGYDFRALPVRTSGGAPAVALTWMSGDIAGYDKVTLVRSVSDYPLSLVDGAIIFNGRASQFLDTNVIEGTRYYYTLFVQFGSGLTQVSFATVVAGDNAPTILSEPFASAGTGGTGTPFDLQFSQLTFTPVGPPVDRINREIGYSGYEGYEATLSRNIRDFPVAREDQNGGSFNLPLSDEGSFAINLDRLRVPFFGRDYGRLFIHANGFVSFQNVESDSPLGTPGILQHFAIPRISGLFTDLAPTNGGQVWLRYVPDRVVVTYENVPTTTGGTIFNPAQGNSFQIEMFYSGTIRITYKNIAATTSFVGLSDGRGVPRIPQQVFPGVTSTLALVDFSKLGTTPTRLHFEPIAPIFVEEGQVVEIPVAVDFNPAAGAPQLSAQWTQPGSPPFGDNGDGTALFRWVTTSQDTGTTVLRVLARQGNERAYQDVRIIVGEALILPEARDLQLSTGLPNEDPSETRIVPSDRPLFASYDYFHPKEFSDPATYGEGPSIIRWFRNGEIIPSLNDSLTVPSGATRAGDVWHFRVIPITRNFIAGEEAISPLVTIVDLPLIEAVLPPVGLASGGERVRILGNRLGSPLSVTFGGVAATSVRVISDSELEVTTPLHNVGVVDVAVRTLQGTGSIPAGFRFVASRDDLDKEDINADGRVDAVDIQLVSSAVLGAKEGLVKQVNSPDVNGDGRVNAADVQLVVNRALLR